MMRFYVMIYIVIHTESGHSMNYSYDDYLLCDPIIIYSAVS